MRRLIAVASITVTMTLAALGLHDSPVSAAAKPTLAVALSPSSAIAGSAGNTLTFAFVASEQSTGRATVTIPASASGAPWSSPQTGNPSGAGYVTVQLLGCNSAVLAAVAGPGPWTLAVDYKCGNNKSFALTYRATAAETADAYVFATQVKVGQVFLPTTVQPVVTVTPAAARTLTMTGLAAATAGAAQSATVKAYDAFGNPATDYLGTVHFTANDPQAGLPGNYVFTAADAGTHAFTSLLTLKTAGSRTVTTTDTAAATITAAQTVSVAPGPAASFAVTGLPATAVAGAPLTATATARDAYGNVATGYGGAAAIASSDPPAVLPSSGGFVTGARTFPVTLKTGGSQSVSATDGLVTGSQTVTILAAEASTISLTGLADETTAGASQSGFVTLFDAYSNVANGYAGTVHFTSSDPNATLPADHTFTAANNGSYPFAGLVLTRAGSDKIVIKVADTVATLLQAVKEETVSPGAVASLTLEWRDTYIPFNWFTFSTPPRNCNVWPYDAYGNSAVLTYRGTIAWTVTSVPPGQAVISSLPQTGVYQPPPPAFIGPSSYNCEFYSPGTLMLTVTDVSNQSLTSSKTFQVVPPSAHADDITVLDPTHRSGLTVHTLDPLMNDTDSTNGDTFVRKSALTLAGVGQATFTENGTTYQLGVARLDDGNRTVIWELNPPDDATASDPDTTLRRCAAAGVGCTITQPITMPYTVTDSVSTVDSTITLHISTPTALFPTPTLNVVAEHYAEPSDAPGFLIPSTITLSVGALDIPNPLTGVTTTVLKGTLPAGTCGTSATFACTFQTTASVGLPTGTSGTPITGTPTNISLGAPLAVTGLQPQFNSVQIVMAPTAAAPSTYFGTLLSLSETACSTTATRPPTPIACPEGDRPTLDLIGLVNGDLSTVTKQLVFFGYQVVFPPGACTAGGATLTGRVTSVVHQDAHPHLGSPVAVRYSKASCP